VTISRVFSPATTFFLCVLSCGVAAAQPPAQNWVPQNFVPQAIATLGQNAASRTEFTLDHKMLALASKTDQSDDSVRRIIAGLDGVSVHRFHYQGAGVYDPALLNDVRQQYRGAGWQHVTVAHDKDGGPGATDLWLHFENNTIRNVAVLFAGRDQVNFVTVSGAISPLDLFHLAGHFGIPKMEGGVVLPAPPSANTQSSPSAPPPTDNGPVDYRHAN
jgi:Domain of unknown function (DUF4252)